MKRIQTVKTPWIYDQRLLRYMRFSTCSATAPRFTLALMHSGIAMSAKWRISGGVVCFLGCQENLLDLNGWNTIGMVRQTIYKNVLCTILKAGCCGISVESSRSEKNLCFEWSCQLALQKHGKTLQTRSVVSGLSQGLKWQNGHELRSNYTSRQLVWWISWNMICGCYEMLTKGARSGFLLVGPNQNIDSDARFWTQLWTLENGCFSQNTVGIVLQMVHRTSLELKSTCIWWSDTRLAPKIEK